MLLVEYPKCTTCRKAKKFLNDHGLSFTARDIKTERPTEQELVQWQSQSGKPWKSFFNTSGQVYRSKHLKETLPTMSDEEKVAVLASDGMLVKRPVLVLPDTVLIGFKESEWEDALKRNGLLK